MCDRLREGEYWCPGHQAPERFTSMVVAKHKSSLKLSVCLRHAVRIIRRLGSRRLKNSVTFELEAHQVQPSPNESVWIAAETNVISKRERPGAELSTTRSCELRAELPTTVSRCYELQSPVESSNVPSLPLASNDAMELDESEDSSSASSRSISPIEEDYDVASSNISTPMSACYPVDSIPRGLCNDDPFQSYLTSPIFVSGPVFNLDHPNYDAVFANHDIACTFPKLCKSVASANSETIQAIQLDQPTTIDETPIPHESYSDEKMICHLEDSTGTNQQPSGARLNEQLSCGPQPLMVKNVSFGGNIKGADGQMQSQRDLIEGLRHVSPILYKRSLRNLRRDPTTAAVRSFMNSMPLHEDIIAIGLATLRRVFSASLPSKLMDIYAMLHVAYVVAIVINQKDVTEVQKDLYADILNWSLAIKSVDERALFVNIAQMMWASEHSKMNCPRLMNEVLSGARNQTCFTTVLPPVSEIPTSSHLGSDSRSKAPISSKINSDNTTVLFQTLKGGTAIYLCKQFLDGTQEHVSSYVSMAWLTLKV